MSNSMIILGDVHLGRSLNIGKSSIGEEPNSRITDQLDLLNWVSEQVDGVAAEHLFITGDIYEDAKPHPALIAYFMRWLAEIPHYTNVHIVRGNHDILRTGSFSLSALDIIQEEIYKNASNLPNVSIYRDFNTVNVFDDVYITIAPYRDRRMLECDSLTDAVAEVHNEIRKQYKTIPADASKILIGHLALEGSMYVGDEIDDIANEIMCPHNIFKGYDAVWMGHVHKPQILSPKNPMLAHTGSMDLSDFGETDHRKSIIVYENNGDFDPLDCSLMELPTRILKKITIDVPKGKDTTKYVTDLINKEKKASFKDAIVRVQIKLQDKETPNINKKDIEDLIYKLGAFHICGFSEHRSITVMNKDKESIISDSMDEFAILKAYAESMDWPKKECSDFLSLGNDVIKKHEEST